MVGITFMDAKIVIVKQTMIAYNITREGPFRQIIQAIRTMNGYKKKNLLK